MWAIYGIISPIPNPKLSGIFDLSENQKKTRLKSLSDP